MYRMITIGKFRFGVELQKFSEMTPGSIERPDILVYAFGTVADVDLKREIEGENDFVKRVATQSEQFGCTVICGAELDVFGVKKEGAIVCNKGVLVDIADRANAVKVYASERGNIGLLLGGDCISERHWERAASASDIVLCLSSGALESAREEVRLFSAAYKLPYLFVDGDGVEWVG